MELRFPKQLLQLTLQSDQKKNQHEAPKTTQIHSRGPSSGLMVGKHWESLGIGKKDLGSNKLEGFRKFMFHLPVQERL